MRHIALTGLNDDKTASKRGFVSGLKFIFGFFISDGAMANKKDTTNVFAEPQWWPWGLSFSADGAPRRSKIASTHGSSSYSRHKLDWGLGFG